MKKAPVFFISHGAPSFAIEPDALSEYLQKLGQSLKDIRAVLVISPHWQTSVLSVMTTPEPPTIHDFSGFQEILYTLQYPAKGHAELAEKTMQCLLDAGWGVHADHLRGLDHGAWVPLLYLLPEAKIPVFQVSMPRDLTAKSAITLGQALAPLREQGVLIIGSGGLTHNLYEISPKETAPAGYVKLFADWMRSAVLSRDIQKLENYRQLAPHAERAHPTDEHLLPLMVALGASANDEVPFVFDGPIYYGMLSMESYFWGVSD